MGIEVAEFSKDYFDRMAELEDRHPWTRAMRALTFHLLRRARTQDALDVGCGSGLFLCEWKKLQPLRRAAGVDFAWEALRHAQTREAGCWVAASAAALPFPNGSFDAIHSADVLQHLSLDETARALDLFAEVLRPGGILVLRLRARRWLLDTPDVDYSISFSTVRIRSELERRGFQIEFLSRVNALPSLAAELREWSKGRSGHESEPVKGIVCRPSNDPRGGLLDLYLRIERRWLLSTGIPLPWGHTILCAARKKLA